MYIQLVHPINRDNLYLMRTIVQSIQPIPIAAQNRQFTPSIKPASFFDDERIDFGIYERERKREIFHNLSQIFIIHFFV